MTSDTMELHRRRITARARQARPGQVLLVLLTGLFMGLGWAAAKLTGLAWFLIAWAASAIIEGWVTGWETRPRAGAPPG